MEDVAPLFTQRGEVGADDGEGLAPPVTVRKHPEVFCVSLGIRISRSAWLLSQGTGRSVRKRRTSSACMTQTQEKIEHGGLLDPATPSVGLCAGRIVAFA